LHNYLAVSSKAKVPLLIVDDDAPIRKLLERVASRAGFDVDTAKDGVEALEMLERKHYAIAIVDLMMPRLSGYELVQKISTMNPRPVVIVATALTNGDVAKIDDTLVRRVIKKPFDVKAVAEALVETARQIAAKEAAAEREIPIVPAETVVIRVNDKTVVRIETTADPKPDATEEKKRTPADETKKSPPGKSNGPVSH
jgi:DNA-binding response OmpR family regulator